MRIRKGKFLFGIVFLCLLVFFKSALKPSSLSQEEKKRVEQMLSGLSQEEKKNLKELFDHLFFFDEFAYSLFGTKPMSIGYLLPKDTVKNGWQAWKKISGSLKLKKFVIREYTHNHRAFILVANLQEIENVYKANREVFDPFLRGRMSLSTCIREENVLFHELMQDHLLVGILLGYGANNAREFAENEHLEKKERHALKSFSNVLHPVFYYFSGVMPPCFACDPNTEETKELKKRYTEERKRIVRLAKRDSLFFQMLLLLED